MRFNKNEDIASYLMVNHPELCEDDVLRPTDTVCVRIPVKAPEGSIFRTETALDTLERVKKFSTEWVKAGHHSGDNTHNVSATISIDSERHYRSPLGEFDSPSIIASVPCEPNELSWDEWKAVGAWMWSNREFYNGLSVLPAFNHTYQQAPFEDITKEEYEKRISTIKSIDLTKVMEIDDNVEFGAIQACAGGQCSLE
jgi:ribonucleoside-diphosphate reductase alpha chain